MNRVTTVDQTQFAKLVGITPRHIQRLTASGVLTKARDEDGKELRGRYELAKNILAYCNYLREQAKLDDTSESKWVMLRNKKMAADAELSELTLKVRQGVLHRAEDVEFHVTNMLTAFKSRVLAIPSRVSRLLVGQTKFQVIYDLIMTEIELCLRELMAYDSTQFNAHSQAFLASQGADQSVLDDGEKNGEKEAGNGSESGEAAID
jgi:phage terminase Nu1 subunit (DNA packaging protein)